MRQPRLPDPERMFPGRYGEVYTGFDVCSEPPVWRSGHMRDADREQMMPAVSTKTRQQMMRDNAKRPLVLERVPPEQWPTQMGGMIEVWLSRKYLVQVYKEADGMLWASINRTTLRADGRWEEILTWDEMQEIKRQIGRADCYAVEVLPRDCDIVNVANMRHMWILPAPLSIGWFISASSGVVGSDV